MRRLTLVTSHALVALLAAAAGVHLAPAGPSPAPRGVLAPAPDPVLVMQAQAPRAEPPEPASAASASPPAPVDPARWLARLVQHSAPHHERLQGELIQELAHNPQAMAWALTRMRGVVGTPEGAELGALLASFSDPQVAQLALELQQSGQRSAQVAGLEMAARLQRNDPQLRAQALTLLRQQGSDPDVAAAALYALRREPAGSAEQGQVLGALQATVQHPTPEVRRRAVIALADWAPDAASLGPVVQALQDPSLDVRAGAAFALGRTRFVTAQAEPQLVARMSDEREDWAVRDLAWRALSQYPLSDTGFGAHQRFADLRAAFNERRSGGDITAH